MAVKIHTGGLLLGAAARRRLFFPQNLIILFNGGTIPSGWTRFSATDDKFIVGAGATYNAGDTGGSTGLTLSMELSSGGGHSTVGNLFNRGCSGSACDDNKIAGAHTHSLSGTGIYTPPYQNQKLIKAVADTFKAPANSVLLAASSLSGLNNILTDGYLFRTDNNIDAGGSATATGFSVTSAGGHTHVDTPGSDTYDTEANGVIHKQNKTTGSHGPSASVTITHAIKRKLLSAWTDASAEIHLVENGIALWESATPPDGWYICDGGNGTPDLRDYFIELVGSGFEDTTGTGDNTVDASYSGSHPGSHDHSTGTSLDLNTSAVRHGSYAWSHEHSGTDNDVAYTPPYYGLYFVMYGG